MDTKLLFDNFDLLYESHESIPALRATILQLAVQGKLVPQDSNEESALDSFKIIKSEQDKLIQEKHIRMQKVCPKLKDLDIPFQIPIFWEWVRLREIAHDWGQKKPDKEFTYIDVATINKEFGFVSESPQILESNNAPSRARKLVKKGTVIYSTVRPYLLNIAVIDKEYDPEPIASTAFAILHPYSPVNARYLFYYLRSKPMIDYVESQMFGVAYPAINDSKFFLAPFPLPPRKEQDRIVAKVDELMRVCDDLESMQKRASEDIITLNTSALAKLAEAKTDQAFNKEWGFISDNFDTLYSTHENVKKLKETILQLAVQGKLVPQNPKDEPASKLLERIKAEKEKLIKAGKLKKEKSLPPIKDGENPFDLPEGWTWCRLGKVSINRDGDRIPVSKAERAMRDKIYDYYGASGVIDKIDGFTHDGTFLLIGEDGANLIARSTPIAFTASGKIWVNNHAHVLEYFNKEMHRYLEIHINAMDLKSYITGGFQPKLSQGNLNKILIALPPLEEQHRIVAKVESMMAMCNELEQQIAQSKEHAGQLMQSVLQEAFTKN